MVRELIDLIGEEGYFQLGRAAGGAMFYVPRHWPDTHWVVRAIGREAADRLCEYYFGLPLVLPVREWRRFAFARMAAQGLSGDDIARALRLSRSSVYEGLARLRGSADQPRLF
jgi:hypothetical protein